MSRYTETQRHRDARDTHTNTYGYTETENAHAIINRHAHQTHKASKPEMKDKHTTESSRERDDDDDDDEEEEGTKKSSLHDQLSAHTLLPEQTAHKSCLQVHWSFAARLCLIGVAVGVREVGVRAIVHTQGLGSLLLQLPVEPLTARHGRLIESGLVLLIARHKPLIEAKPFITAYTQE
jgi:hypothetical protein